jgi:hypothetical protein
VDREGRTIFIAAAHRDDGKRFVARADEKLTAFVELESRFCAANNSSLVAHDEMNRQLSINEFTGMILFPSLRLLLDGPRKIFRRKESQDSATARKTNLNCYLDRDPDVWHSDDFNRSEDKLGCHLERIVRYSDAFFGI